MSQTAIADASDCLNLKYTKLLNGGRTVTVENFNPDTNKIASVTTIFTTYDLQQIDNHLVVKSNYLFEIKDSSEDKVLGYQIIKREVKVLINEDILDENQIQVQDSYSRILQDKKFAQSITSIF